MDVPLIRQTLVAVSPQLAALSVGGSMVYPTLLMQQLKGNDSFVELDIHTQSWIGSIHGLSGLPVIFMPTLMQWKGRKLGYIITCSLVIIGWILSLTANNLESILASEAVHGFCTNSLLPVSALCMTEMLSPKYRLISMQIIGLNLTLGVAFVGIMGRFFHFRTISVIMLVPSIMAFVIACFWPESPPWLALKGDFDKCQSIFKQLRGTSDKAIKELNTLIETQKESIQLKRKRERVTWRNIFKTLTAKDFYLPSSYIFLLMFMLYWSGGDVIIVYFIELAQKTTKSENATFYGSIVMYSIIFIGSIITNITIRRFKNKTVLLSSTAGIFVCLMCISVVTLCQRLGVVAEDSILCIYFLVTYVAFYSLGLNAMVFYISAELMPVKHRAAGGALYIVCNCGLYACSLKLSPYLMLHADMCGTFLLYALNAAACALLVHRYVPETKGRTLTEIEDYYNYGTFIARNSVHSQGEPMNP